MLFIEAMGCQLFLEIDVGDSVRGFAEVLVDTSMAFPSSTRRVTWLEKESRLIRQDPKPFLTGSDPLVVLYVPCDGTPNK